MKNIREGEEGSLCRIRRGCRVLGNFTSQISLSTDFFSRSCVDLIIVFLRRHLLLKSGPDMKLRKWRGTSVVVWHLNISREATWEDVEILTISIQKEIKRLKHTGLCMWSVAMNTQTCICSGLREMMVYGTSTTAIKQQFSGKQSGVFWLFKHLTAIL